MLNVKEVIWGNPLKAETLKNDLFDEMFGAEMLELSADDMLDLTLGETLYIVIEGEYVLLIRYKEA